MLSSKKSFMGASTMALVVALVGAAACLLLVMAASVGSSRPAEAQSQPEEPDYPLEIVKVDSPRNASGFITQAATCPPNHQVISGGFDRHNTNWDISDSYPNTPQSWAVAASADYNPLIDRDPFTVYAVCAPESLPPPNDLAYHRTAVTIEGRRAGELTPQCLPNYRAIGGGFRMRGPGGQRPQPFPLSLVRTQPNPGNQFRSWIVAAVNRDDNARGTLTAYSVCVRDDSVTYPQFHDHAETGNSANYITTNTRSCQGNAYLLSGGAGTPNPNLNNRRAAAFTSWSHIRPGPGIELPSRLNWSARARVAPSAPPTLHAHLLCGRFLTEPAAGGGAGGGEEANNNDGKNKKDKKKKQGKHRGGDIKIGKNFVKVGGIKVGKNFVKVGGIRIANGEVRVGSIRLR